MNSSPFSFKYSTTLGKSNGISRYEYTNLILPSTLKIIESTSFITVTAITVPDEVESIELGAFTNSNLESIVINNNARFKTIDGVLFSSDGKELISYPRSKKGSKYSVPEGVTHICDMAFYYNENLDSVHLPTSIENIGRFAYYNSKLKYINLNDSIYEIGRNAFSNCLLTEIDIPTNLEFLEIEAFSGCPLKKITSRSTLPATASASFDNNTYLNAKLIVPLGSLYEYKDKDYWKSFVNIKEQDIDYDIDLEYNRMYSYEDNGITISLKRARNFDGRLVIPDYLMIDGQKKYVSEIINFNSVNAQSLILPESLEFLDGNFCEMRFLRHVYLSQNISHISGCFYKTPKLSTIEVNPNNKHFCVENSILFSMDKKRLVIMPEGLGYKNYTIPEGVEDISESFWGNKTIESITIPSSVKKMGAAFSGCTNLKKITFTNGLTRIDGFEGCVSLEEITIPASVDVLASGAFKGCSNLKTIIIKQTKPCYLNDIRGYNDCFDSNIYENAVLVVPMGCSSVYKTSDNWSKFKHIEERDLTDLKSNRIRTTIDGITYSCDLHLQEATIIRYDHQNMPKELALPSNVSIDGMNYPVTEIGPYSFAEAVRITSINIPEGIKSIGDYAFDYCLSLIELHLPTTLRTIDDGAFRGCRLVDLDIPEGCKTIGKEAFESNSLINIHLPSTIEYIDRSAFAYCDNLIFVSIHNSYPKSIPSNVFLSNDWTKFLGGMVWNDNALSNEDSPQLSRQNKATLYVPEGTMNTYLSKNGWNTFSKIEEGEIIMKEIDGMTYNCYPSKQATLSVGNKKTSIVTIPSHISINGIDYLVTAIGANAFQKSDSLVCIVIPNGIKEIERESFEDCEFLEKVDLPSSLTTIDDYAFSNCSNLDTLIIPEGVVSIGVSSFSSCYGLRTVVLPSTIKMIDQYAFNYCNLSSVIVRMDKPCKISENVFNISSTATLYVPVGTTDLYKNAAGWNKFQNILEGEMKEVTIDGMTYIYATGSKIATLIKGQTDSSELNIPSSFSVDGVDIAVTTIGRSAFYNNTSITKLTVSEGIKNIEASAFGCCYSLEKVDLPSSLKTIEDAAFVSCIGLSSVIVRMNNPFSINENVFGGYDWIDNNYTIHPSSATLYVPIGRTDYYKSTAGWNVFQSVLEGELKEVTIDGMTYVYVTGSKIATLIKGESNSSELNIPSSISIDGIDIDVTTIGRDAFFNNNSITKLTVSEGIKIIEASAFGCCYSLEKVDLPSSLTTIDDCAFDRCGIIDTLIIPEGVERIGVFSFYGCDMLRTVVLPSTIKMIDECAFNDCKLSSVIVRINNPFEINDNVFAPISPNAVLCVPEGTASKYQETAGWNTFAIIAEPVVIKANDYIIQYGEELPDFSYTSYGVGLSGTPQITCAATTHSPVGTYPIVISKGSVTNYNDMYINGTLTITKAPLTITALNDTIRRHEVIPEFSVVYSGFKNNEDDNVLDIKPSLSCNAASDSGLGDYEIIVSGAEAKNYDITYINGKLTIKAGIFILKYLIDNELFQTDSISYGTTIQPPMWSERVGYTFSGWSEIPTTMPAKDVEVTGTFVVNKYLLQVLIDEEVVYSDSIAYGTQLAEYVDLITEQGIDITQWEWYCQIDTITMPAHDVVINAVRDAVLPVLTDSGESAIYDITGKKIETEDITTLPAGIYIRNGRKFIIR